MIARDEFLAMPVEQVARLVHEAGEQVCVFPINGTRRWFMLEHGNEQGDDPLGTYMDISAQNHISLYKLIFDHGVDTLITPVIGPDILLRGDEYLTRVGGEGLARLAQGADFLDFYDACDVRVHFYGNHHTALAGTPYAHLSALFDEAARRTSSHQRFRLFFGVFGDDATDAVAEFAVHYQQEHGQIPDRRRIIEMYYGEYVEPVSFFIGFDRFTVFDYPLLASGGEDLYFTTAPSPYLTAQTLREILYDHLFTRRDAEPEYARLSRVDRQEIDRFYQKHQHEVLGVGRIRNGFWTPVIGQEN